MSDGFSSSNRHYLQLMDKENVLNSPHEDATGLTRCFSRSVSLQQPRFNFKEKPVFSGSPETTICWSGHSPAPVRSDEDAWNLIYAAAGHVARMKMSISDGERGAIGGSPWRRSDGQELFRQQHFCRSRCVAAWPPPQLQNPRHQQNHVASGGGATATKRGTGVFLPRRYCNDPPESRKRQACPPANPPARVTQSSLAPPQIQPRINTSFVSHYEMLMSRRKAMISGAQRRRSNIHDGVMEAVNNPEVLLPQEWTY